MSASRPPSFTLPKGYRVASKGRGALLCIEGEYVTLEDIARRTGASRGTASKRLSRVRKKGGPVTWASLGEVES